jgi:hypothetical protein
MNRPIPAGDAAVNVLAEHAQRRGHAIGFDRGRLDQIERDRNRMAALKDSLDREISRMDELSERIAAEVARMNGEKP